MGRGISAESQRNRSRIVAESLRKRFGIVLESYRKPCRIYLSLIQAGLHATLRFHADFTQILRRMGRGILAESKRNRKGFVPESF